MAFNISIEAVGADEIIRWAMDLPFVFQGRALQLFDAWGDDMAQWGMGLSPRDPLRGIDPRRKPESESLALNWDYDVFPVGAFDAELDVGNVAEHMPFVIFDTGPRLLSTIGKGHVMYFVWHGDWHTSAFIMGGVAAHGTKGQRVHDWILLHFIVDRALNKLANAAT